MNNRVFLFIIAITVSLLAPSAQLLAIPLINEAYFWDSNDNVFIELFGDPNFDLNGYTLEAYDPGGSSLGSLQLQGLTGQLGFFLITDSSFAGSANQIDPFPTILNESGGSLILTQNGTVTDALSYGTVTDILGEGTPAISPDFGFSLSRDEFHSDTGDNASDFLQSNPTPQYGTSPVPEPATMLLLSTGLVGLVAARRKFNR